MTQSGEVYFRKEGILVWLGKGFQEEAEAGQSYQSRGAEANYARLGGAPTDRLLGANSLAGKRGHGDKTHGTEEQDREKSQGRDETQNSRDVSRSSRQTERSVRAVLTSSKLLSLWTSAVPTRKLKAP